MPSYSRPSRVWDANLIGCKAAGPAIIDRIGNAFEKVITNARALVADPKAPRVYGASAGAEKILSKARKDVFGGKGEATKEAKKPAKRKARPAAKPAKKKKKAKKGKKKPAKRKKKAKKRR